MARMQHKATKIRNSLREGSSQYTKGKQTTSNILIEFGGLGVSGYNNRIVEGGQCDIHVGSSSTELSKLHKVAGRYVASSRAHRQLGNTLADRRCCEVPQVKHNSWLML
jgi:hypothetical protein